MSKWLSHAVEALAFCVLGAVISLHLGQDDSYDLLNYHLYNAWAFLHGVWSVNYFAAEMHTFIDPLVDLPYYLAFSWLSGTHPQWAVMLAGVPYGLLLFLALQLAREWANALALNSSLPRITFLFVVVVIAGTGAATWSQVGLSTNEIVVALPVLAALLYLWRSARWHPLALPWQTALVTGGLMGLAVGLKLTAAIYAPALAVAFVLTDRGTRKARLVRFLIQLSSVAIAFIATYGFWGVRLYRLTGNPFFPMFNQIFRSPWVAPVSFSDKRFLPHGIWDAMTYPFQWLVLNQRATEVPSRDARIAVLLTAGLLLWACERFCRERLPMRAEYRRLLSGTLGFAVLAYLAWLVEFSVLRYLVVLECVAALVIVSLPFVLLRNPGKAPWMAIAASIALGVVLVAQASPPDWRRMSTDVDVMSVQAPVLPPHALVIFASNPMAYLAQALSERSHDVHYVSLDNNFLDKKYRLNPHFDSYQLLARLRNRFASADGKLFIAYYVTQVPPEALLAQFGIKADLDHCLPGGGAATWDFRMCPAAYVPGDATLQANAMATYRLAVTIHVVAAGGSMHVDWLKNDCSIDGRLGRAKLGWHFDTADNTVLASVGEPPAPDSLMDHGLNVDQLVTGDWVSAGQHYLLRDSKGHLLAQANVHYERCN